MAKLRLHIIKLFDGKTTHNKMCVFVDYALLIELSDQLLNSLSHSARRLGKIQIFSPKNHNILSTNVIYNERKIQKIKITMMMITILSNKRNDVKIL